MQDVWVCVWRLRQLQQRTAALPQQEQEFSQLFFTENCLIYPLDAPRSPNDFPPWLRLAALRGPCEASCGFLHHHKILSEQKCLS